MSEERERLIQISLRLSAETHKALQELADANGMGISQLVRFVALKIRDNPEAMGLRSPKEQ